MNISEPYKIIIVAARGINSLLSNEFLMVLSNISNTKIIFIGSKKSNIDEKVFSQGNIIENYFVLEYTKNLYSIFLELSKQVDTFYILPKWNDYTISYFGKNTCYNF